MLALFQKFISRLRTHGLGYFAILVGNEIRQPRFAVTRYVRSTLIAIIGIFRYRPTGQTSWCRDCLQFCYDLSAAAITYDFASYLAAAEVERRLRGFAGIYVIFVMGPHGGVREEMPEYEAAISREARLWRVRQMLIPMLSFLPTVRGHVVCSTREVAEALISTNAQAIYPSDYRVFLPRQPDKRVIHEHARRGVPIWPMFKATAQGRRLVADFLAREAEGRRPIVITLRNYAYTPERNSRNADWIAFADGLDRSRYVAIFIHDSETVMQPPPGDFSRHVVCDAASVNLELRMALYEAAWLNMALLHGPTELCWYCESARYLYFIRVGTAAVQTEAALIQNGHRVGSDLDFAKPFQHIVWEVDEYDVLCREFALMEKMIEESEH